MEQRLTNATWISGKGYDTFFFCGPALLGCLYAFLILNSLVPTLLLWIIFSAVFDVPHLLPTFFRVFQNDESKKRFLPVFQKSLLWLLLGPLVILLSVLLESKIPFEVFLLFFSGYNWWHLTRQNYGFLAIYQKKNRASSPKEMRIDFWHFHGIFLLIYAYAFLLTRHLAEQVSSILAAVIWISVGLYFLYQMLFCKASGAKLVFLFSVFLVPLLLIATGLCLRLDSLSLIAVVSIQHSIQYQAFVWCYLKRSEWRWRLRAPSYVLACVLFGVLLRSMEWSLRGSFPEFVSPLFLTISLTDHLTLSDFFLVSFIGFSLQHYYLDQHLWRINSQPELSVLV